jgi:hypothetical protein
VDRVRERGEVFVEFAVRDRVSNKRSGSSGGPLVALAPKRRLRFFGNVGSHGLDHVLSIGLTTVAGCLAG